MIASLPMYDRPANAAAHDAFWALIRDGLRARGIPAPDALDRETPHMEGWGRPDLVLGQICNLPYRARFRGRVTVIGSADHGLAGCPAGHYRALFVVREDDPATDPAAAAGGRFAFSEGLSQSGWGAAHAWAAARGLALRPALRTGAHAESARAVAEGRADLCTVDARTWALLEAEGLVAGLRVIGATDPSPGMTFITAPGLNPAPYFAAIASAIARLDAAHRDALSLRAIVRLPDSAYRLPLPPDPEAASPDRADRAARPVAMRGVLRPTPHPDRGQATTS